MPTQPPDSDVPYDVVVVGLGAVGSAALNALSASGYRVLGLDPSPPCHALGSSHGHTRVFRHAYFEHPDYVPILRHATATFERWETAAGVSLLHRAGVLVMGPRGCEAVEGSRRAARQHGLEVHDLDGSTLRRRYPQFAGPPELDAVFEADAGFVRVERAIGTALQLASAPRWHGVGVASWERLAPDRIVLRLTDGRKPTTRRLALAAGAWTGALVPSLKPLLTVTRQVQTWVTPAEPALADATRLPCWLWDQPGDRHLYGIPADPERTGPPLAKVAVHGSDCVVLPDAVDRVVTPDDLAPITRGLSERAPGLKGRIRDASVCLYTSSPDEHFIVDRLPEAPEVAVVCGLSGHGFKMAPALGRVLADLCLDGKTDLPVGFLGLNRFG